MPVKIEATVVGSRRRVSVSQDSHLRVGSHDISFKSHDKSLGIYIDATLTVGKHTDHISRPAYLEIRRISSVRHLLMCSLVLSRLAVTIFLSRAMSKASGFTLSLIHI